MGATNCPETPRQKMITMMYLVYTAMLALNVSAEVVEGFRTVGTAMTKSNINLQEKLDDTYANFKMAYDNSPAKVGEKWEKAQQVREMSKNLTATIDSIEYEFIGMLIPEAKIMVDPATETTRTIKFKNEDGTVNHDSVRLAVQLDGLRWMEKGLDNTNDGTRFFLGADAEGEYATEGAAFELKQKILEYERNVKEILGEDSSHVTFGFNVDKMQWSNHERKELSWEMLNFRETVAGSGIVTLIRMKGETMNAEFDAVNMLYKQVSKGDFKFDKVTMLSRPKRTYIVQGGTYETRINVGAYDSHQSFTATINGQTLTSNDSGAVVYRTVCNTPGMQKMRGTARVSNPETETGWEDITFEDDYYVSEPMATISLDNMNVLYTGVENPFTPSVPGIDSRNIQVHVDPKDGKITPGEKAGSYNIVPTGAGRKLEINVTATIDGKQQNMGSIPFRVKPVPDPIITVNDYESGGQKVSKKKFTEGNIIAAAKNPSFDFKLNPRMMKITHVEARLNNKKIGETDGYKITADMANKIKRAESDAYLYLTVTVTMPDGKPTRIDWIKQLK